MSQRGLVADIGGTNSRFRLVSFNSDGSMEEIFKKKYRSASFSGISEPINLFLSEPECKGPRPAVAALAVAGPVHNNKAKLTNVSWELDGDKIALATKIPYVQLLNDFEAIGYGLSKLGPSDVIALNPKATPVTGGTMACLGAGTGLGQVFATKSKDSKYYTVHPTEGGHTNFGPRNRNEFELMEFIRKKRNVDHVSTEMLVSGTAIPYYYMYYAEKYPHLISADKEFHRKCSSKGGGVHITGAGRDRKDTLCQMAVEHFVTLYGAEAGNFALKTFPTGGMFVAGGVAEGIRPIMRDSHKFLNHALAKGPMQRVVDKFPFYLITHDNVGVLGAKAVAQQMIEETRLRSRL